MADHIVEQPQPKASRHDPTATKANIFNVFFIVHRSRHDRTNTTTPKPTKRILFFDGSDKGGC
jgi:hypothetical protein